MPIPRTLDVLNSFTITEAPGNLQNRYDYDGGELVVYAGYAPMGSVSSEDRWTIFKYTYSGSQVTLKQTAYGNWDNRATYTYA